MTAQQQYQILRNELNEQQWRVFLGTEALKIGYGGISLVAKLSGADWKTVRRGVKELRGERARAQGRIRQVGGGRKKTLQTLANAEQLTITVAHSPPATVSRGTRSSIASALSFPSGFRAKLLTSLETVIEVISHTTTKEGWHITAIKDSQSYPTGVLVTDAKLSALSLVTDAFHGEWTFPIKPQDS